LRFLPLQTGSHWVFRGYKSADCYHRASLWGSSFSFPLWKRGRPAKKLWLFFFAGA